MNLNKDWELKVDEAVLKVLRKFSGKDSKRIAEAIELLPFNFYVGDIQKIKGEENTWRKRIGNYRIFYEISKGEKIIHVFWVERRTSKTY